VKISIPGTAASAPFLYPVRNLSITGIFTPPIKPIFLPVESFAAM